MFTKHLISGIAAAAIVTTVGLAYAQSTGTDATGAQRGDANRTQPINPATTTPGSTASEGAMGAQGTPSTQGTQGTQGTLSDSTTTGNNAAQADRN